LSDINKTSFQKGSFPPDSIKVSCKAIREEVEAILKTRKPFRALGRDGIPNGFLQAIGPKMANAITLLATACWELGYYPQPFKNARTIALRKLGKPTYKELGAWRLIALLSTIRKVIETLTAKRLSKAVEENSLLLDSQIGARAGRSTKTGQIERERQS